ncbi:MAG: hypothetical protein ACYDEX_24715 [Mobilitalea sp.]
MFQRVFLLMIIIISIYTNSHSQSQFLYGPVNSTYRRSLTQPYSNPTSVTGVNLPNPTDYIMIGFQNQYQMNRAVYQWDLRTAQIPLTATIDSVTIEFSYQKINSNYNLQADFYAIPDSINGTYIPDYGL